MYFIPNLFLRLAVANGFVVVILGAFGSHMLRDLVGPESIETWKTAVQYHMFHVTGMLAVNLTVRLFLMTRTLFWSGMCFMAGILLFCGSLYLMVLTDYRWLGIVTPVGGTLFLLGWGLLFISVVSHKE